MKFYFLVVLFFMVSCASKHDLKNLADDEIIVIGRAVNFHAGKNISAIVIYRTGDRNAIFGNPKAHSESGNYFTAIIKRTAQKFAVKELRMKESGHQLIWGNHIKQALAESQVHPLASCLYIGDLVLRTKETPQGVEVEDFGIFDRTEEARVFAREELGIKKLVQRSILKMTIQ